MQFSQLRVVARQDEIETACSIFLEKPNGFAYKAGQHLPIRFFINGKEARRTYTLSSSPHDPYLQITVKRVKGGLVSNHINDSINVGDIVEARPPIGHIYVAPNKYTYCTYYLFAAGSGVTPMWSIARTVLDIAPYAHVRLIYGNQSEDTILFRKEMETLQQHVGQRLQITHVLSTPKKASWSALWSSDVISDAQTGRVDAEALKRFLDENRPISQNCAYYICGPGSMNTTLQDALLKLQVPNEDIHIEYFKAPEKKATAEIIGVAATATVNLNRRQHSVAVPRGSTVLQACLDAGIDAPYSCEAGICATCRAQLTKGTVHMASAPALEEKEIQQGAILTCQAMATSAEISLSFN
ncbi:MAG: 2Fe-2S iron-sulfur cluster-binding protein [Candidatus Promineifilaceae bacterium]